MGAEEANCGGNALNCYVESRAASLTTDFHSRYHARSLRNAESDVKRNPEKNLINGRGDAFLYRQPPLDQLLQGSLSRIAPN